MTAAGARRRRPQPARLWTAGEDLPLFSGTPIRPSRDTLYAERDHVRQMPLPGLAVQTAWRTWQIADDDIEKEEQA